MSALDEHLKKHRKQIIDREENTFREMLDAYADIEKELKKSFDDLQKQIEEAIADGEEISPSWLFRQKRLKNLLAQVREQIVRFGGAATEIIEREQRAAIQIAVKQAQETYTLEITGTEFPERNFASTMNPRAVETAVGMMGDGSPILTYYKEQLAPMVAKKIKTEVVRAAATGTDFKTISKRLQESVDITKHRALSVARTEVNRVRRESTRQIYEDNSDILSGWEWIAAKSTRTCPLCLAMDGKQFALDEPFPQHVNCRCTMKSIIIGIVPKARTLGREYFENLSDEDKKKILGKEAFLAQKEHGLTLDDFVAFKNDKRFGKAVTRKPLAKILADKNINPGVPQTLAKNIKYKKFEEFKSNALHGRYWNERVAAIINENPVAQSAYRRIRNTGTKIIFEGEKINHETFGVTEKLGGTKLQTRIFLPLTETPEETVSTIVHESRHVKRWTRNKPVSTKQEEILARCLEFVYNKNRRPNKSERHRIRKTVEKFYKDLPEK